MYEIFYKYSHLKIQDRIYNETKLLCSIGVAPNKFLAKMASDYKKPMGITIIRIKDVDVILNDDQKLLVSKQNFIKCPCCGREFLKQ